MTNNLRKYLSFDDVLLLGALLIALGLAWNTVTAMQRNYRLQQKYNQLYAEVELYELENQNLKYNIEYLKTDDYLELAAREKFNKAIEGETMVYLPKSGNTQQSPVVKNAVKEEKAVKQDWRVNLRAWWNFLLARNIHH